MKRIVKCCLAVVLGLAMAGCSEEPSGEPRVNSIKDGGHSGVQLWKDGPYWAEKNVGAENPWDCGYYFWWGDTIGYKRVNDAWVASDGSSSSFSFEKENTATYGKREPDLRRGELITEEGVLAPKHDAAYVHWGGKWRMPTDEELKDLCDKCDWEWTTLHGVNGYVVRGKGDYTPASIFLPCAGYGGETSLYLAGSYGYCWSSVQSPGFGEHAWRLYFCSDRLGTSHNYRYCGRSVRPVQGFTK